MKKVPLMAIVLMLMIAVVSCGNLSTRTPESPDNNTSGFIPPTSADIVISNFTRAVSDLNVEDYLACLYEDSYQFDVASSIYVQYPSIFADWTIQNERTYFSTLISEKQGAGASKLVFNELDYEIIAGDSTVISAIYNWNVDNLGTENDNYTGKARLTIVRDASGLWYIKHWTDYEVESDSITETWSRLKAFFSN